MSSSTHMGFGECWEWKTQHSLLSTWLFPEYEMSMGLGNESPLKEYTWEPRQKESCIIPLEARDFCFYPSQFFHQFMEATVSCSYWVLPDLAQESRIRTLFCIPGKGPSCVDHLLDNNAHVQITSQNEGHSFIQVSEASWLSFMFHRTAG